MSKTIIETSNALPTIDEQIDYIRSVRADVIRHLKSGLDMIVAIEQSLIAARLNILSKKSLSDEEKEEPLMMSKNFTADALQRHGIKLTLLRLDVLEAILLFKEHPFTTTDIETIVTEKRTASRTSVIKTIMLLQEKGIVKEAMEPVQGKRRNGRPEKKFKYSGTHA
jgi:predicted transcriptional regulator